MAHIWVRVVMKEEHLRESSRRMHQLVRDPAGAAELKKMRFRAYADNIRLAKKGVRSAHPVLEGRRSVYTAKLPRSYAVEEHMLRDDFPKPLVIPKDVEPVRQSKFGVNLMQRPLVIPAAAVLPAEVKIEPPKGPIEQTEPSVAPIRDMIVKGCLDTKAENNNIYNSVRLSCVAASDPKHILVGFYIFSMGSLRAGPTAQVPLGRWCTAAIATVDGKTWRGLDGSEWPTVMGGNISKVPPRQVDVGGNIGGVSQFGCSAIGGAGASDSPVDMMFFVRSALTERGYWKSPKFFVSGDPRHCHNVGSGDLVLAPSGRIWGAWAGVDRFASGRFSRVVNSKSTWLYYSDDGGVTWQSWRGVGFNGAITFLGDRQVRVAPYRGHVAVFGTKGWTVFDGKEWKPFAVPGRKGARGQISVCGWKRLVFIEPDETGRKLLMWQREGAEWRGPKEIFTEEKPIVQLKTPRYSDASFVPVVYMCTSGVELPKAPEGERTFWPYGFNSYPSMRTPHEPWIKVFVVPVQ